MLNLLLLQLVRHYNSTISSPTLNKVCANLHSYYEITPVYSTIIFDSHNKKHNICFDLLGQFKGVALQYLLHSNLHPLSNKRQARNLCKSRVKIYCPHLINDEDQSTREFVCYTFAVSSFKENSLRAIPLQSN